MNKKVIIIIVVIFLVLFLTSILISMTSIKNKNTESLEKNEGDSDYIVKYDEETALYYLVSKDNEDVIITASSNKNDLQFYIEHPGYNPALNPVPSKTLEEYWAEEQIRLQELQEE